MSSSRSLTVSEHSAVTEVADAVLWEAVLWVADVAIWAAEVQDSRLFLSPESYCQGEQKKQEKESADATCDISVRYEECNIVT